MTTSPDTDGPNNTSPVNRAIIEEFRRNAGRVG
ncbi:nitroreductase family deazaflavin-dependent oxidoreductase, partial [Marinitenerispora sediminis]